MDFTSERLLGDLAERTFTLDGVPGILWTPAAAPASSPAPLTLLGHPGLGLAAMYPRLAERARRAAEDGFASAAVELPGSGDRPRWPAVELARADLREAMRDGGPISSAVIDTLVLPLADRAVPEARAALDALLALPGIREPVGYSGGNISVGVRLAAADPRVKAAVLFAGSLIPAATFDDARRVGIPLHVLLQWDDEGNDRQAALDLFDAFGSAEKTLEANMGGHRGVPAFAGDSAARFLARHLA